MCSRSASSTPYRQSTPDAESTVNLQHPHNLQPPGSDLELAHLGGGSLEGVQVGVGHVDFLLHEVQVIIPNVFLGLALEPGHQHAEGLLVLLQSVHSILVLIQAGDLLKPLQDIFADVDFLLDFGFTSPAHFQGRLQRKPLGKLRLDGHVARESPKPRAS